MRQRALLVGLTTVLAMSSVVFCKPDLAVTDLELRPENPSVGQRVTITATVRNVGDQGIDTQFSVRFGVDGQDLAIIAVPSGLADASSKRISTTSIP